MYQRSISTYQICKKFFQIQRVHFLSGALSPLHLFPPKTFNERQARLTYISDSEGACVIGVVDNETVD